MLSRWHKWRNTAQNCNEQKDNEWAPNNLPTNHFHSCNCLCYKLLQTILLWSCSDCESNITIRKGFIKLISLHVNKHQLCPSYKNCCFKAYSIFYWETLILVLTTLFISVSKSLPPTAYVKMIDVWLIFSQLIPFAEVKTSLHMIMSSSPQYNLLSQLQNH